MHDLFLKQLMTTIKCGICGRHYEAAHINVLSHQEEFWFVSVFCPACQTRSLMAAVVKEGKAKEVVTDLTEAEYAKFADSEAVEIDDSLDLHNFLKDFDGDFVRLFSKR